MGRRHHPSNGYATTFDIPRDDLNRPLRSTCAEILKVGEVPTTTKVPHGAQTERISQRGYVSEAFLLQVHPCFTSGCLVDLFRRRVVRLLVQIHGDKSEHYATQVWVQPAHKKTWPETVLVVERLVASWRLGATGFTDLWDPQRYS